MPLTLMEQTAGLNSLATILLVKVFGMNAENQMRQHRNESPAYVEVAYKDLLVWYGEQIEKLKG